jgi:hypothetical protein
MAPDRIECGGCGTSIMCGSFTDSPAQYLDDLKAWAIRRAAPCDTCGAVTVWWELASEHGRPLGTILQVQTPRVLRGDAAREFFYSRDNAASNC